MTGSRIRKLQPDACGSGLLVMNDEQELVRRVLARDEAAFRTLVERYERLVAHIVAGIVAADDRDDVGQDVFVRVYRRLDSYRGEAPLSTWIARVAVNTALHHAEKRRPTPTWNRAGVPAEQLPSSDSHPDDSTARRQRDRALYAAIAALPPAYRVALSLFHLDGFSIAEIAVALGMPVGTVKSNLFRARRLLKEALLAAHPLDEWDLIGP